MKKNIKAKVRNYIINKLVNMVSEIKTKYENKELEKFKLIFKSIGNNISIEYPYLISGSSNISIGDNFRALSNCRIQVIFDKLINENPQIVIGNNVSFESNCHIGAINKIIIEDGVMIASNVYISDHSHGDTSKADLDVAPDKRRLFSKGPIIIHKNVFIGDSVCILPGVIIGENAIIGANSVVTKNVPANSVVAGVPAIILKQL
jgi:acetyltransferase-like isoleucine patch superfamily enzyme